MFVILIEVSDEIIRIIVRDRLNTDVDLFTRRVWDFDHLITATDFENLILPLLRSKFFNVGEIFQCHYTDLCPDLDSLFLVCCELLYGRNTFAKQPSLIQDFFREIKA